MADRENMDENSGDEEMEYAVAGEESSDDEGDEGNVYMPGMPIPEGHDLVMTSESNYLMYHEAQTGAPCLSFDIIRDNLGDKRETYPLTAYCVSGTQADRTHTNNVIVFKMSNMHKIRAAQGDNSEDEELSDDEDEANDEDPVMSTAMIKHNGGVNRIRSTQIEGKTIAASMSDTGKVHIWDLTTPLTALDHPQAMAAYKPATQRPLFTFGGHPAEGFAVDWSPTKPGRLATGDNVKNIHVWEPGNGTWNVNQVPYTGHAASVEDIQWSPNEESVFASCSTDRSIRIWDARCRSKSMIAAEEAHIQDVNVISWNSMEPFIVSGGDEGMLKVWDLRQFQTGKPVASFKHHHGYITSVQWSPVDSTVFAACGHDDQLTIWDLAVERDSASTEDEVKGLPPQLLFIHQGQEQMKELHFHRQLPGVLISTAHSGFNIFRPCNM